MSDDLLKRLREISSCMTGDYDGEFDNWAEWIGRSADRIEALTAENERLRTGLRFYAAWGVFAPFHDDAVRDDGGDLARSALGDK